MINYKIAFYLINMKHIFEMFYSTNISEVQNWQDLLKDYVGIYRNGKGIIKLKNGTMFNVNYGTTDKWSIHEIVIRDDYKLNKLIKDSKVIFDLGANIGVFSVYAASLKKDVKIYSFEPDPENYKRLLSNIHLNNLSNISPFQLACSDVNSKMKLYIGSDHRARSLAKKTKKYIEVPTNTLASLFNKNRIKQCDLLKIDIEGSEYPLFFKTKEQFLHKVKNILMEYHNLDINNNGDTLQRFLQSKGFDVYKYESVQHDVGLIYASKI